MNDVYKPKKRYGQNFLIDKNIINKIVDAAQINHDDTVIEIGAGTGALTQHLVSAKKVIAIEIDKNLVSILKNKFITYDNVEIIHGDILKLDLRSYLNNNIKIISNLPYYISSAIITKCADELSFNSLFKTKFMIFMLQKEVAQRLTAKPSEKLYGCLSLIIKFYFSHVLHISNVTPNCFIPKPKVNSSIVKLIPRDESLFYNKKELFEVIFKSFSQRRKTLANCLDGFKGLTKSHIEFFLTRNNMANNIRGESLDIYDFINLTKYIFGITHTN
jgi:16S rRNA (adenine1518-N6/adenine1519-N6)-dimethyltransferase